MHSQNTSDSECGSLIFHDMVNFCMSGPLPRWISFVLISWILQTRIEPTSWAASVRIMSINAHARTLVSANLMSLGSLGR